MTRRYRKDIGNATEEGVRMFYDKLRESKDVAATVLQKNVYENYPNLLQYQRRFQISFIDRDGFFSLVLLP